MRLWPSRHTVWQLRGVACTCVAPRSQSKLSFESRECVRWGTEWPGRRGRDLWARQSQEKIQPVAEQHEPHDCEQSRSQFADRDGELRRLVRQPGNDLRATPISRQL